MDIESIHFKAYQISHTFDHMKTSIVQRMSYKPNQFRIAWINAYAACRPDVALLLSPFLAMSILLALSLFLSLSRSLSSLSQKNRVKSWQTRAMAVNHSTVRKRKIQSDDENAFYVCVRLLMVMMLNAFFFGSNKISWRGVPINLRRSLK